MKLACDGTVSIAEATFWSYLLCIGEGEGDTSSSITESAKSGYNTTLSNSKGCEVENIYGLLLREE